MKKLILALALLAATGPTQAPAQPTTAPPAAIAPAPSTAPPAAAAPQPLSQTVTDKHPYAVYFILIAASLAALASLASSSITAWVTWKSKDKEYKNDYYKKVIEKRIRAIEITQEIMGIFSSLSRIGDVDKIIHMYFTSDLTEEKFSNAVSVGAQCNVWLTHDSSNKMKAFTLLIVEVEAEVKRLKVTRGDWVGYCIGKYEDIERASSDVEISLAIDMRKLHDVDKFFVSKIKGLNR